MAFNLTTFFTGFTLGATLIIAIGAQNAFILRQGLLRQNVFLLCLICAVSDALLIGLGVFGFGEFVRQHDGFVFAVTIAGAIFLFAYGLMAFHRAQNPTSLSAARNGGSSLFTAITTCLALTFLNPHVYLDTVLLLGGISSQYAGSDRYLFGMGAGLASFVWFFSLGYGARFLVRLFENPKAWRVLDLVIGLVMWLIATSLLIGLL